MMIGYYIGIGSGGTGRGLPGGGDTPDPENAAYIYDEVTDLQIETAKIYDEVTDLEIEVALIYEEAGL